MNTEQQTIFPDGNNHTGSTEAHPESHPEKTRNCDHCGRQYPFSGNRARFCSDRCRKAFKSLSMQPSQTETNPEKKTPAVPTTSINTGKLSPEIAITIDLLKADSRRWEDLYKEERTDHKKNLAAAITREKKLQDDIIRLESEAKDKEHKHALQGIEARKPDFMDRIANLPEPVLNAFAPILGRLANLIPEGASGATMAGTNTTQLDEGTVQFLAWVDQLPDDEKKSLFTILGTLTTQDPPLRKTSFTKIENLLIHGTTMQNNNSPGYDRSMYGN
jgi:hypothetical protein